LLSAKAAAGQIKVVQEYGLEAPRTSAVAGLLRTLGVEGKALLLTAARDAVVERSAANLPGVKALPAASLNVADLLRHDVVVATPGALEAIAEVLGE
ncbi:MAG: 50S ribosomal protein L4, partial [Armatimonadetes bacterium]|nr:50S ribosomal protein L4 [Armatimonadota bacterium]